VAADDLVDGAEPLGGRRAEEVWFPRYSEKRGIEFIESRMINHKGSCLVNSCR